MQIKQTVGTGNKYKPVTFWDPSLVKSLLFVQTFLLKHTFSVNCELNILII